MLAHFADEETKAHRGEVGALAPSSTTGQDPAHILRSLGPGVSPEGSRGSVRLGLSSVWRGGSNRNGSHRYLFGVSSLTRHIGLLRQEG